MNKIYLWRYYIAHGELKCWTSNIARETSKCYFLDDKGRLIKADEGKVEIKSRTFYPYIDVYFREEKSREEIVEVIIQYLKEYWGLN